LDLLGLLKLDLLRNPPGMGAEEAVYKANLVRHKKPEAKTQQA
jgi:hypothetical protein